MKKKFAVLLICITLLTAGAGGFIAYEIGKPADDEIRVDVGNGQTERVISVKELNLAPAKEKTVTVKFTPKSDDPMTVTLAFEQTEDGELKNYVTVIVKSGDLTESARLDDLLGGRIITLEGKVEKLTITYRMDESAGNEAQGAKIGFDVKINASTEE